MVRRFLFQNLSYANIVATLALVLAITGGAYAATQLPKNSVGSKQVKDSSLKAKDFKPGQLPAGATGPTGATGAAGPRGLQGLPGTDGTDGAPGPSVLVTGAKSDLSAAQANACPTYTLNGDGFTVPQPAVLFVDGKVGYHDSAGTPRSLELRNTLLNASDQIVGQASFASLAVTSSTQIGATGMANSVGVPVVLQPGTTYHLRMRLTVSGGDCNSGFAYVESPVLTWIAYPATS